MIEFFQKIVSKKWEQKHKLYDTYYTNNDNTKLVKVYEDYIEFDAEQAEYTKSAEIQKN